MKNIHLIPTDNYSPLVYSTNKYGGLFLSKYYSPTKDMGDSYQNIYITSNEEIKDCWVLNIHTNQVYFVKEYYGIQPNIKKIILTTDFRISPDLQKMDDEFLEWFVKNPSCEEVEIERGYRGYNLVNYKIIIPKEEPKRETFEEAVNNFKKTDVYINEIKQEPVKDLAYWKANAEEDYMRVPISVLRYISELENQRYSEEEVKHIVSEALQSSLVTVDLNQWFEQFKKK